MIKIKRFIECLLPVTACNLRCSYCYVIQRENNKGKLPELKYSVEQMSKALTVERLGGVCYFSICGAGETMLPAVTQDIVKALLSNGHVVNITTNGTLTNRFEELLSKLDGDECKRLHFAFSLHYLELVRLNKLDCFADNVRLVKNAGCSFLVQLNLCDEYVPHLQQIKDYCMENFGAYPQLAATRKEIELKDRVELMTEYTYDEYMRIGEQFESPLFDFTMKNFNVKRTEFCYAGDWSFTLNLATGKMKRCYACEKGYDIFKNAEKPIPFCAIGKHCKSLFCMNSSHFMSMGVIPDIVTPSYAQLRNRTTKDGGQWYSDELAQALSGKLSETNASKHNAIRVYFKHTEELVHGKMAKMYGKLKGLISKK